MRPSHIHIAFKDPQAARDWFQKVLNLEPLNQSEDSAVFRFGDVDLVIDRDWGRGDTSMTFAVHSSDCGRDFDQAVRNGAHPRTLPRDKGGAIGADVFGPGELIFEFEQLK